MRSISANKNPAQQRYSNDENLTMSGNRFRSYWCVVVGKLPENARLLAGPRPPLALRALTAGSAAGSYACFVLQSGGLGSNAETRISSKMDTLGIEPRASRMLSGCDTTTPCAHLTFASGFGCCLLCWSRGLNWMPSPSELSLVEQHTFMIFEFRRMQFGQ